MPRTKLLEPQVQCSFHCLRLLNTHFKMKIPTKDYTLVFMCLWFNVLY